MIRTDSDSLVLQLVALVTLQVALLVQLIKVCVTVARICDFWGRGHFLSVFSFEAYIGFVISV